MGDRLQAAILLLGICSFLACATALLASWHYIHTEHWYSEDDYEHYDSVDNLMFFVEEPSVSYWGVSHFSYNEIHFDAVGNLFDVVKILCFCGLAVIVMSTVAALKTSWRYSPVLALLAPVPAIAALLLFSLSFPAAMSEGLEATGLPFGNYSDEITGLYGSEELYFEYDNSTVKIKWSVDIAWWMMIGAFSMTLAQTILIGLYPPSGQSLKMTLFGRTRVKEP